MIREKALVFTASKLEYGALRPDGAATMWSAFLKVILGFFLAIALIAGGGYLLARQVIAQLTAPPPKPMFPNDNPAVRQAQKKIAAKPSPSHVASASPSPSPVPVSSPSPSPSQESYSVRVTLKRGLNLREGPSRSANKIGGLTYSQQVTVLEESQDKQWVKVRLQPSGQEGWVFSSHTERVP